MMKCISANVSEQMLGGEKVAIFSAILRVGDDVTTDVRMSGGEGSIVSTLIYGRSYQLVPVEAG